MNARDVIIAGAGIVGLAAAYQILRARPGSKVLVLEKELEPGLHQTGRNSGVVHTGVYYKPGSLKAKNCIEGRKELLEFCEERGIPIEKKYKLIVATRAEEGPRLREIYSRGVQNGVPGLKIIGADEVKELEPHVSAIEALLVPECHIVQYREVAKALVGWIRENGGEVVFGEAVERTSTEGNRCIVAAKSGNFEAKFFVNCAGLFSDRIARASLGKIEHQILPFRGEYYEIVGEKKNWVKGLIYPVPDPKFPFLGVHVTPMIGGKMEAGPNAILAFAREGYRKTDFSLKDMGEVVSYRGFWQMAWKYWKAGAYEMARSWSKRLFLGDLQRLVPGIEARDLAPGGAGIRAQVVTREGKLLDDFAFMREKNMLHVLNAPSPAATASFSIGRTLNEMIG